MRIIAAMFMLLVIPSAQAQFGQNPTFVVPAASLTPCTATGLDFTQFCNSQYIFAVVK